VRPVFADALDADTFGATVAPVRLRRLLYAAGGSDE
jgi:hypothetical protein